MGYRFNPKITWLAEPASVMAWSKKLTHVWRVLSYVLCLVVCGVMSPPCSSWAGFRKRPTTCSRDALALCLGHVCGGCTGAGFGAGLLNSDGRGRGDWLGWVWALGSNFGAAFPASGKEWRHHPWCPIWCLAGCVVPDSGGGLNLSAGSFTAWSVCHRDPNKNMLCARVQMSRLELGWLMDIVVYVWSLSCVGP